MSTKCTIRHGTDWHLYEECMEDDAVYLELENVEVKLSSTGLGNSVTIRLENTLALDTGLITEEEVPKKINWNNIRSNFDN